MKRSPTIALNEVQFIIKPFILDSMGHYFLVYQVDTSKSKGRLVFSKGVINDKYCFFFNGKTSFHEYTKPTRFIINPEPDEKKYFENKLVYWADPDGTTHLLEIKPDKS